MNTPSNVRVGPGITYGTIAGGAASGAILKLIGRNNTGDWYNVVLPNGEEGWILNSLVTVNAGFDTGSLEVVEAAAPAPVAAESSGATAPAASTASGAPPVAPVGNVGNFELGGQAAGMPAGIMQYAGMSWVKKQHKWGPGDSPESVAGLINEAHASGLKILLSIPGQLSPSSIDFQAYTDFLGGVAALGPDAIEVWNEMNIDREWPAGQIDPASYVNNMLKPAYQKIKASNPNVMVITGAPAPTGYFGGCSGAGCDDAPYVAGMMAAGAGGASDCIGVHYNEGIMPPSATSGDPRGAGEHYTRYFQGMINAYTAAGAGQLSCRIGLP
ncbi:MAG: SH3 domain-containing protein [Chloroflexota bacterium]